MQDEEWLIDWRGARRWLAAACDRKMLLDQAGASGSEVWQLRGAEKGADVFPERSEAYRNMLQRLKQALDPGGVFNPGRLYSWM
jgi:glycolate oxidase FAD binding subunit